MLPAFRIQHFAIRKMAVYTGGSCAEGRAGWAAVLTATHHDGTCSSAETMAGHGPVASGASGGLPREAAPPAGRAGTAGPAWLKKKLFLSRARPHLHLIATVSLVPLHLISTVFLGPLAQTEAQQTDQLATDAR